MAAISWKSAVNGNWNTAADWSSGTVPGSGDAVTIGVAGAYTVSLTSAATVASLAVTDASATLAVGASLNGTTLNNDGTIQVAGGGAGMALSGAVTNIGNIAFAGKTSFSSGAIANQGMLDFDATPYDSGGGTASIGTLTNDGQVDIGNVALTSNVTVTAAGITNNTDGLINLIGGIQEYGGTGQAILKTTAAAPATLNGGVSLTGAALLEFGSGGIVTIAGDSGLSLDGTGARVVSGAGAGNSGLASLATVNGALELADGAAVATKAGLVNNSDVYVDSQYGPGGIAGGSSLRIGGVLTNNDYIGIGNDNAHVASTVIATGLVNNGTLDLAGEVARATLDITGAAPTTVTNDIYLYGDALLEFASGGIATIAQGADLWMHGARTHVSLSAAPAGNGALSQLATDDGKLSFDSGVVVTTKVGFTNNGDLYVDNDSSYGSNGGSKISFGGTFVNNGFVAIGNGNITAATTVTATGLTNGGQTDLTGNTSAAVQATLAIAAAAPSILEGDTELEGDALLSFTSGAITTIAGTLELDGALSRVTAGTTGHTGSALSSLASVTGQFYLEDGAAVATGAALDVTGSLVLDDVGNGGSRLSVAGTLTNQGNDFSIGESDMTAASAVTVGNLVNDGTIDIYGATAVQGSLTVGAATPSSLLGKYELSGDALLAYKSGAITTIGYGNSLALDGAKSRVASGAATTTNSALTTLSSVGGLLALADGAVVKTTTSLNDTGTVELDEAYDDTGGSQLAIGGTLTVNAGVELIVGNVDMTAATTLSAAALVNEGSVRLYGGATAQASLDLGAAAPGVLTGYYALTGDALLSYKSGGIATIAGTLGLDGAHARVSSGTLTATNSALTGLTTVSGAFYLMDGATVTTGKSLTNSDVLDIDTENGGGSRLTVVGTLTNNATLSIGSNSIATATLVTAGGLVNDDTIYIAGNSTVQASLVVGAAAPATLSGYFNLSGDALLSYKSGAITAIASGGTLQLNGARARVASGTATATNSALTTLASVAGTLDLENGAKLTTTTALEISGQVNVDTGYNAGGSDLAIGGTLTIDNPRVLAIGNQNLSAATTVTATGLANNGTVDITGGGAIEAALDIGAAAPSTLTGDYILSGDAVLDFKSGGITAIQGELALTGDARVASGAVTTTSSALTELATNSGQLYLSDGATLTTNTALANSDEIGLDGGYGRGGSSLTVTGTLTNEAGGTVSIGNSNTSFNAASTVTATGLANAGLLDLYGSGNASAQFTVSGNATNTNYVYIGANSELDITGSHSYTQTGTNVNTEVQGSLVATTVDVEGGTIEFFNALANGDGTGTLVIGASGTLALDDGAGTGHGVTFNSSTGGTLKLGAPASFLGTISGFAGSDIIDLVDTAVTAVSYSGTAASGVLTVKDGTVTVASLHLKGDYTHTNFTTQSDNNGGTEILDPPAAPAVADAKIHAMAALLGQYAASSFAPANGGHGASVVTDPAAAPSSLQLAAHALA